MARVQIETQGWGWYADRYGNGLAGKTVTITGTVYSTEGGGTVVSPIITNSSGLIPGWIDSGTYDITIDGVTRQVEAAPGVPGGGGGIGYNAQDYGILGDGVTNYTTAIEAFYNAIPANSIAYFPAGVYIGTHDPDKSIQIIGDGINATEFRAPAGVAANTKLVDFGSSTKCSIKNVKLNANDEAGIVRGVNNEGNGTDKHLVVENVWFENFTSTAGLSPHTAGAAGIYVWTADAVTIKNNFFVDCVYPVYIDTPGPDCEITNNRIWCTDVVGLTKIGILLRRTSQAWCGALISGNTVSNCRTDPGGIGTEGHAIKVDRCMGVRITGNQCDDVITSGIHIGANSYGAKVTTNEVSRCSIANGAGIYVEVNVGVRTALGTGASTTTTAQVTLPATPATVFSIPLTSATGFYANAQCLLNDAIACQIVSISGTTLTCITLDINTVVSLGATVTIGSPEAVTISNNNIHSCLKFGISNSWSPGTIISNNTVHDNGMEGIFSDSARTTITDNKCWNNWLRNNAAVAPTTNPNVKAQIRVTSASGAQTRPTITNNDCWDSMPASVCDYGIAVGDYNAYVSGNTCTGHAIGPIYDSNTAVTSTNTFDENPNYRQRNTEIIVSKHGLGTGSDDGALLNALTALYPRKKVIIDTDLSIQTAILARTGSHFDAPDRHRIQIATNPGGSRDSRIIVLESAGTSDVIIENVELDGNARVGNVIGGSLNYASTSFLGGLIQGHNNSEHVLIRNVRLLNAWGYLVNLSTTVNTHSEDWTLEDVYGDGSGMAGDGGGNHAAYPGLFMTHIYRCLVRNARIFNTGDDNLAFVSQRGASGGTNTTQFCKDYVIDGGVFDTVKKTGSNIAMTGENGKAIGVTCKNSLSSGGSSGTDGAIRVRHSDVDTAEHVARKMLVAGANIYTPTGPGLSCNAVDSTFRDVTVHDPNGLGAFIAVSSTSIASGVAEAIPDYTGELVLDNFKCYSASDSGVQLSNNVGRVVLRGGHVEGGPLGYRLDLPTTAGQLKELVIDGIGAFNGTGDGIRVGNSGGRADACFIRGVRSTGNTGDGVEITTGTVFANSLAIHDNPDVRGNTASQWNIAAAVVPTSSQGNTTLTSNVSTPAVPTTDVALVNPYGIPATVYISGGTVTQIYVNNSTTNLTSGSFRIAVGGSVKITYSVAPTVFRWVLEP